MLRSLNNFKYDISIVIGPFFKKFGFIKINPKIKIIKNKSFR